MHDAGDIAGVPETDSFGRITTAVENLPLDGRLSFRFNGPVYISFDIDGLDPAFAPGVSHPEPGGLTVRQALRVIHDIEAPIVGADIVEFNPKRDVQGMTAFVAAKLVREIAAQIVINAA